MQDSTNVNNVKDIGTSFEAELKQYLLDLMETLKEGGEFMVDQLPIFVTEYLNWSITSHSIGVLLGIGFLFIAYKGMKFIWEEHPKGEDGEFYISYSSHYISERVMTVKAPISIISAIVGFVTGIPMVLINLFQLGKVLIAPRVYLIENLMNLI